MRMNGCAAKIHLALDGLPEALAMRVARRGGAQPTTSSAPTIAPGTRVRPPGSGMTIPTLSDPSLAPAGKHVASIVAQNCPHKLRDTSVNEARHQIGERSLAVLEDVAPGLKQRVTAMEVLTPHDLEKQFGMTGGQWHHGEITLDQVLFLRPARPSAGYACRCQACISAVPALIPAATSPARRATTRRAKS
jgi:phytoene dehydrogenase-like protein